MYRPSTALQKSFGLKRKGEGKKQIQEKFSMYEEVSDEDDLEAISEEDELGEELGEEEAKMAGQRLEELEEKILEKTNMLKETQTALLPEPEADAGDSSDDGLDAFMHEDHESEEEPIEERSPKEEAVIKLKDKISLLRHRCESGLGNLLFEQVFKIIKDNKDSKVSGEKT